MALQTFDPTFIQYPLSDLTIGDTQVKQMGQLTDFHYHKNRQTGEAWAKITLYVTLHADIAGGIGPELPATVFGEGREEYLVADNNTLVDAETGEILAIKGIHPDAYWQELVEGERLVELQGVYFDKYSERIPEQSIADMWRWHILNAVAMGKFTLPG
ncbi:hypothetical protein [Hymenobacter tenuis]